MVTSMTIIAALKYQGGVVIGADSQASDLIAQVRWPVDKLRCVPGGLPCVIGFSGSMGKADQARTAMAGKPMHANTFKKRELVHDALDACLAPVYEAIQRANHPPTAFIPGIALWGLAAMWAENAPQILEFEINGDSSFHEYFHAIGSASATAYAIYRTLGGSRLSDLDEVDALMVLVRILRTCVGVEVAGVGEPITVWTVDAAGAKSRSRDELEAQLQLVEKWQERERAALFGA
jgi:20S proteasome alpha/beta subunit